MHSLLALHAICADLQFRETTPTLGHDLREEQLLQLQPGHVARVAAKQDVSTWRGTQWEQTQSYHTPCKHADPRSMRAS